MSPAAAQASQTNTFFQADTYCRQAALLDNPALHLLYREPTHQLLSLATILSQDPSSCQKCVLSTHAMLDIVSFKATINTT
jgi:hypothetical protein